MALHLFPWSAERISASLDLGVLDNKNPSVVDDRNRATNLRRRITKPLGSAWLEPHRPIGRAPHAKEAVLAEEDDSCIIFVHALVT